MPKEPSRSVDLAESLPPSWADLKAASEAAIAQSQRLIADSRFQIEDTRRLIAAKQRTLADLQRRGGAIDLDEVTIQAAVAKR